MKALMFDRTASAFIATGLALSLSGAALAQDTASQDQAPSAASKDSLTEGTREMDWELHEIPDRKATIAMAQFNSGITLATRCVNNVFEVTVHGLPEAEGFTRTLDVIDPDGDAYASNWIVGAKKDTAFSRVPVRFARLLARGGQLSLRVPAQIKGSTTRPPTRYVLDLPPSVSAVEQTLVACGKSMTDLRYDSLEDEGGTGLPQGLIWSQEPKIRFPSTNGPTLSTVGYVTVTCGVSAALRPENCLIESEYPAGFHFGRAVMRSVEQAQLRLTDPSQPLNPQATILFNINFRMD